MKAPIFLINPVKSYSQQMLILKVKIYIPLGISRRLSALSGIKHKLTTFESTTRSNVNFATTA